MLEGLDAIDWKNINTAYGQVDGLPELLNQLLSQNEAAWNDSFRTLHELINHQDSLYEVTPYVIPFFIQLIQNQKTLNRHELLVKLWSFYPGCISYLQAGLRETVQELKRIYGWQSAKKRYLIRRRICKNMRISFGVLVDILLDKDPLIRNLTALILLTYFGNIKYTRLLSKHLSPKLSLEQEDIISCSLGNAHDPAKMSLLIHSGHPWQKVIETEIRKIDKYFAIDALNVINIDLSEQEQAHISHALEKLKHFK